MITKKIKYKYRKRKVDTKQDRSIVDMTRNKTVVERFKVSERVVEIERPIFYLEAKDIFFDQIEQEDGKAL